MQTISVSEIRICDLRSNLTTSVAYIPTLMPIRKIWKQIYFYHQGLNNRKYYFPLAISPGKEKFRIPIQGEGNWKTLHYLSQDGIHR